MRHSSRSFIGHNSEISWSQFWEGESGGQVYCLINLASYSPDTASTFGHHLLEKISAHSFQTSSSIPADINQLLTSIKNDPEFESIKIELSLAVIVSNNIHLGQLNPGDIFFQHQNKLAKIISGQPDSIICSQGQIVDSDRLFFSSSNFSTHFSIEYLAKTLALPHISSIEETILSDLVNLDNQDLASACLVEFHPEVIVDLPPPPPPQDIPVSHLALNTNKNRRRWQFFSGVAIFLLLVISIIYGYRQNQIQSIEKKYLSLETQIQQAIDQSQKLKSLNLESSQQEAKKAEKIIADIKLLKVHSDKVSQLEKVVNSLLVHTGSTEFKPSQLIDTTLIAGQLNFSYIRYYSGKVYLLDPQSAKLFNLSVSEKSHQLVSDSPTLKNALDFAVDKNQITLLTEKNITILKNGQSSSVFEFKDFRPILFHLWNSNVYYLTSYNIYKSAPNATSYSTPQVWLKNNQLLNSNTTSLSINGSIWTITSSGQISSYNQGVIGQTFNSPSSDIKSASKLQAAPDYDKLVFVDGQNIIYVYNKTGQSVSKFNLNGLTVSDITLDSVSNTIYILCTDQKIYQIQLN